MCAVSIDKVENKRRGTGVREFRLRLIIDHASGTSRKPLSSMPPRKKSLSWNKDRPRRCGQPRRIEDGKRDDRRGTTYISSSIFSEYVGNVRF